MRRKTTEDEKEGQWGKEMGEGGMGRKGRKLPGGVKWEGWKEKVTGGEVS